MAALTLKSILGPRSANYPAVVALRDALGSNTCVIDASGKILLGEIPADLSTTHPQFPVLLDGITLGHVTGPAIPASALADAMIIPSDTRCALDASIPGARPGKMYELFVCVMRTCRPSICTGSNGLPAPTSARPSVQCSKS